jgi:hypothetical protein
MRTKALRGLKITDAAERRVEAVFATFDVKDHDNDVTLKGAFDDGAPVRISAYNHASWAPGALPAGKGQIRVSGSDAILDGQFFDTTVGQDTFETVKQMGDLQEWSYGYDVDDSDPGEFKGERVRFLKKLKVYEVSPVLLGAGVETRTLMAKARNAGPVCGECGKSTTPLFDGAGDLKALVCSCGHVQRKQLDSDLEGELVEAAQARWGSGDTWVYLYDHDLDENFAVFGVTNWDLDGDTDLLKVTFTRGQDGGVTLGQEELEVDAVITFVPDRDSKASKDTPAEKAESSKPAEADDEPASAGEGTTDQGGQLKLADHFETVTSEVDGLTSRLADVVAMRAEKGKAIGDLTRESANTVADRLDALAKSLREVVASAEQPADDPEQPEPATGEPEPRKGLTLEDEIASDVARARARLAGISA